MGLGTLLLILVGVAIGMTLFNRYVDVDNKWKALINTVVFIAAIFLVLDAFGFWDYLNRLKLHP